MNFQMILNVLKMLFLFDCCVCFKIMYINGDFKSKFEILNNILDKLNQLHATKTSTTTSTTTTTTTSGRVLMITVCGCFAVPTCRNLVDWAGTRAFQATPVTPCPTGMLYCCPTTPTTTTSRTTTTTTTTTTQSPNLRVTRCDCYRVRNCQSLIDGSDRFDFRIVTPQCPTGSIYCCVELTTNLTPAPTIGPLPTTTKVPSTTTVATSSTTTTRATTTTTTMSPSTSRSPATTLMTTTTLSSTTASTTRSPGTSSTTPKAIPNSTAIEDFCGCYFVMNCQLLDNGVGSIDFRIVTPLCPTGSIYCCPSSASANLVKQATAMNAMSNLTGCGIRMTVNASNLVVGSGQARYGYYPWQAVILNRQNDYIAGGVLISNRYILTVAHRITNYTLAEAAEADLKVRLGDWDALKIIEPYPVQEYNISQVIAHPKFNPFSLNNDIALIQLSTTVPLGTSAAINTACLPPTQASKYIGRTCWVTGWGRDQFIHGSYQAILREVQVPILESNTCQQLLRSTSLGTTFSLSNTSLCAGGRYEMDACVGDGGSPLVCQTSNTQWTVVGLVSWGVGCGLLNVPGIYTDIAQLLPWIRAQIG